MLSREVKNRLEDFGSSHHPGTGTDLFVIPNAHALLKSEPDFVAALVAECEEVEGSTWAKRFAVVHSTFELDYVALVFLGNRLVGFASLGVVTMSEESLGLYLSEIMISPDFQRRGLSKVLLLGLYEKVNVTQAENLDLTTIVLSGHVALFRSLLSTASSKTLSLSELAPMVRSKVHAYLKRDTGDLLISDEGVVEGVWAEQAVRLDDVWPKGLVEHLGLPSRVNLAHGDSVVRLFSLDRKQLRKVSNVSQLQMESHP